MDKRKYNRVPEDTSQQQMFVEDVCDSINELDEKADEAVYPDDEGNITLTGSLSASSVKTPSLTSDAEEIAAQKPIVEVMGNYSVVKNTSSSNTEVEPVYYGVCKNGNKITFVVCANLTKINEAENYTPVTFIIPSEIGNKLFPVNVGPNTALDNKLLSAFESLFSHKEIIAWVTKGSATTIGFTFNTSALNLNTKYFVRYEATFLLSDNLAV